MVEEERAQRFPISIHAPTRGATTNLIDDVDTAVFQSTLPRGERQHINLKCRIYMYFNPRSHEGSDPFLPGVLGR